MRDVPAQMQQRLTELYAAFNARDIPTVLAALAPDVAWANGWEGGAVHGHDEVRAYWTRQWAEIDPTVTPTAFDREPDDRIAVTVDQTVRSLAGDLLTDNTTTHLYAFRADGLVTSMEIRPEPAAAGRLRP
jgi:nuclear transport factor 2 (NTF2) superfamily protein